MSAYQTRYSCQTLFLVCLTVSVLCLVSACTRPPEPTLTPTPSPTPTPKPPMVEILTPSPETEFNLGPNEKILASGAHNLSLEDHVWIFLKDIYGWYYLQNPHIELLADGTWEATNIRPRKEIRYIIAIYVNSQGHERIQGWVRAERWGNIGEGEVKGLEGYLELDRVPIITPGVTDN